MKAHELRDWSQRLEEVTCWQLVVVSQLRWAGLRAVRWLAKRYRSQAATHCWVHFGLATLVEIAARCGAHLQSLIVQVLHRPCQRRLVYATHLDLGAPDVLTTWLRRWRYGNKRA